jgi:hypothetical protein
MRDENENDGADGGGSKRIQKSAAINFELYENPSADERTDDSQDNVRDAAKAAAARDFSGKPSGDEADENPAPESSGEDDPNTASFEEIAKE